MGNTASTSANPNTSPSTPPPSHSKIRQSRFSGGSISRRDRTGAGAASPPMSPSAHRGSTATTTAAPTPPPLTTNTSTGSAGSNGTTTSLTLRPNRKSIDLPGLNTFAPAAAPTGAGESRPKIRDSRSRLGRGREGRGSEAAPPRSAAIPIAIPGAKGRDGEEQDTGYGRHAREGIARRKQEEREREAREVRRGRSPTRPQRPHAHDTGLRAPSPSRSNSSRSHSHSRSRSRSDDRSRDSRSRRGRSFDVESQGAGADAAVTTVEDREQERERYEQLYGPGTAVGLGTRPFIPEVVYSTIPLTIGDSALIGGAEGDGSYDPDGEEGDANVGGGDEAGTARGRAAAAVVDEIVGSPPPPPPLTPVPITWRGPAAEVFLIRAGDDDWMGRRAMERVDGEEGSPTEFFTTTLHLPPGTHHFRFIVDGQTVVAPATEIPNAVDDQGFIANYVAVPGPVGSTTPATSLFPTMLPTSDSAVATVSSSQPSSAATSATVSPSTSTGGGHVGKRRRPSLPMHPDGSFWAHSSAGGSGEDLRLAERAGGGVLRAGSGGANGGGKRKCKDGAVWTSAIPEALVRAAAQEEALLDAQAQYLEQQQQSASRGRHIVLTGFEPEATIPGAPRLPRHLERLILNRPSPGVVIPRVGTGAGNGGSSGSSVNRVGTREPSPSLRVTTASGTDVSAPVLSMTSASHAGQQQQPMRTPSPGTHRGAATHPQFGNMASPMPAPGRGAVSTGAGGTPLIADDPSVLQTPSHAVLYHLCTSSIRDKMMAIGASTRYRQKYLTTVYYKPAVPTTREEEAP
ncbi:5'-AMP-activated protein kinase beta subunit, interation domain-containing protein [Mycena filopes]|nr:5'-AMP-activated protein kinase beta subunit, interation domain-containing protein [Mycena filopes]